METFNLNSFIRECSSNITSYTRVETLLSKFVIDKKLRVSFNTSFNGLAAINMINYKVVLNPNALVCKVIEAYPLPYNDGESLDYKALRTLITKYSDLSQDYRDFCLLHELGHYLYTDSFKNLKAYALELCPNVPPFLISYVNNVVEDSVIQKKFCMDFNSNYIIRIFKAGIYITQGTIPVKSFSSFVEQVEKAKITNFELNIRQKLFWFIMKVYNEYDQNVQSMWNHPEYFAWSQKTLDAFDVAICITDTKLRCRYTVGILCPSIYDDLLQLVHKAGSKTSSAGDLLDQPKLYKQEEDDEDDEETEGEAEENSSEYDDESEFESEDDDEEDSDEEDFNEDDFNEEDFEENGDESEENSDEEECDESSTSSSSSSEEDSKGDSEEDVSLDVDTNLDSQSSFDESEEDEDESEEDSSSDSDTEDAEDTSDSDGSGDSDNSNDSDSEDEYEDTYDDEDEDEESEDKSKVEEGENSEDDDEDTLTEDELKDLLKDCIDEFNQDFNSESEFDDNLSLDEDVITSINSNVQYAVNSHFNPSLPKFSPSSLVVDIYNEATAVLQRLYTQSDVTVRGLEQGELDEDAIVDYFVDKSLNIYKEEYPAPVGKDILTYFLLDVSGSMAGDTLDFAKQAIEGLMYAFNAVHIKSCLLTFSDDTKLIKPFDLDIPFAGSSELTTAFNLIDADCSTEIEESLNFILNDYYFKDSRYHKIIIIATDGAVSGLNRAVAQALADEALVFVLGLDFSPSQWRGINGLIIKSYDTQEIVTKLPIDIYEEVAKKFFM